MPDPMNSTPMYKNFTDICTVAKSYLIVMQQPDPEQIQQLFAQLNPDLSYQLLHLKSSDDDEMSELLNDITQLVFQAKAGMHSIVVGDESFLWVVHQCLNRMGVMADEISMILESTQQPLKTIYCVHCGTLQQTFEIEFCHCEHCQVYLLIRSHFSQRLGAYMGVCANPHQKLGVAS